MANYFQLIDRIVSGLSDPNTEARSAVYERARVALTSQLRVDPSVTEDDVARENAGLAEAISRVEAKFADQEAQTQAADQISTVDPDYSRSVAEPDPSAQKDSQREAFAALKSPTTSSGAATSSRIGEKASRAQLRWSSLLGLASFLVLLIVGVSVLPLSMGNMVGHMLFHAKPKTDVDPDVVATSPDEASVPAPIPLHDPTSSDQETRLAERAALLVDAPEEPQRIKVYTGSVIWSLDKGSSQGQLPSAIVRADIDVPAAKLKVRVAFQKHSEPQFPATHTIELNFAFQPDTVLGKVKQIEMPEMRQHDAPTGDPLAGLPVTIMENHFLVGLALNGRAQNMRLIAERNWFDVPVLLQPDKRAKLTFEKGVSGQQVWDDARKAWQ